MASSTRNRLAGVAVLGVAGLAFYLGMNFKGPGLGGGGDGVGVPTGATGTGQGEVDLADNPLVRPPSEIFGDEALVSSGPTHPAVKTELVTVVVDDPDYRLTNTSDIADAKPASLSEVAQAASLTQGDGQGIRVRIYKTKTARAGTLKDLELRLIEIGLNRDSIQVKDEFLP